MLADRYLSSARNHKVKAVRMRTGASRVLHFVVIVCGAATAAAAVATNGIAATVAGTPKMTEYKAPPAVSVEQLKAQYRRPASLPFPKDNPYTTAKAELGKALFFRTRLSGARRCRGANRQCRESHPGNRGAD
jgi:cytochrome c peroxidase